MLFVLSQTKIPSRLTKLLLYQQCILDGIYSGLVVVVICTRNLTPTSNTIPADSVLCYIFQSGFFTMNISVMSFCNVACQSVDRLWALVYPQTYRFYMKYYITICIIIIPVYSMLATATRLVKVKLRDGSCSIQVLPINKYTVAVIESVLRFYIPMCF